MVIPDFTAFNSLYWAYRSTSLKASAGRSEEVGMYSAANNYCYGSNDYLLYDRALLPGAQQYIITPAIPDSTISSIGFIFL